MSPRSLLLALALAASFIFASASYSIAADGTASCGATPHDALAAAKKALASGTKESEATAIACIIEALKPLDGNGILNGNIIAPATPKGSSKPPSR